MMGKWLVGRLEPDENNEVRVQQQQQEVEEVVEEQQEEEVVVVGNLCTPAVSEVALIWFTDI